MEFITKRRDTKPIEVRCQKRDNAGVYQPVNLTNAESVKFLMKDLDDQSIVNADMMVVDPVGGVTRYEFLATDTDTAGSYIAEVQVVDENGVRETFPADGYIDVIIVADLGD